MAGVGATERTGQADSSQQIDDTEGAGGPDKSNSSSSGEGNQVFKAMKRSDSALADKDLTAIQDAIRRLQGAGDSTPESLAYAAAMAQYNKALEKYNADLDAHNGANARNVEIDRANLPHENTAAFWDEMRASLLKVTSHDVRDGGYISREELKKLLHSSDPLQRSCADFLLNNWESIPAPKYDAWGGGMNVSEMLDGAVAAGRNANLERSLRLPHVDVPAHPGSPPQPPPVPGQSSQAITNSSASTGATSNLNSVPPFSSASDTGEGRLLDGIDHLQAEMDALEKDIVACKDNPAQMQALNNKYTKLQTAQSMLMQLLKQRNEMMNNIQKMYSDMAMSAVRNMR
ncbi:MAG: hypothetical protein ABTQ32_20345 [Myxococcaceae bacterium]